MTTCIVEYKQAMPKIRVDDISLEYEDFGNPDDPCVLLIMGLGTQMTAWPITFCEALVAKGFRVIRYDNRDIGLSSRLDHLRTPNIPFVIGLRMLRLPAPVPYSLKSMADDAIGLLDALEIPSAHVVGASMGGMIAQLLAGHYPERTLSLTSIMSTTGHRSLPPAEPEAMKALMMQPDDPTDMESVFQRNMKVRRVLESPAYRQSDEALSEIVRNALQRGGYNPSGVARQLGAIVAAGDRRKLLKSVACPALVIHGEDDLLVKLECGVDTAQHLRSARLVKVPGMGHDIPEPLTPKWADMIHGLAQGA